MQIGLTNIMNEILASIYRKDEYSLLILLQDHRYQSKAKLDETLRVVLNDDSELQYHEKLHYGEMLMCAGASPNIRNWNNEPMLCHAIREEDTGIFELLLNFAPDVNSTDDSNRTALHVAAEKGQSTIVGNLLAAGASPNIQDEFGDIPLGLSICHNDGDLIDMLLIDSNINHRNLDRESPLLLATLHNNNLAMTKLISQGAEVDAPDIHGDTPLIVAASYCNLESVKRLVDAGADVHRHNIKGNTVLHKACQSSGSELTEIVKYLLQCGCKIDQRNQAGNTPLFIAVDSDNTEVMKILIHQNCDVDLRGNAMFGRCSSPIELAMLRDNIVSMVLLLLAGCKYSKLDIDKGVAHMMLSQMSTDEAQENESFNRYIDIIKFVTTPPQTLQFMCRNTIRQKLGERLSEKLDTFNLPSKIKDYLFLKEMDQITS